MVESIESSELSELPDLSFKQKVAKELIDRSDFFIMIEGILEEEIKQTTDDVDELFVKIYEEKPLSSREIQCVFKFRINVIRYLGDDEEIRLYVVYLKKLLDKIK